MTFAYFHGQLEVGANVFLEGQSLLLASEVLINSVSSQRVKQTTIHSYAIFMLYLLKAVCLFKSWTVGKNNGAKIVHDIFGRGM